MASLVLSAASAVLAGTPGPVHELELKAAALYNLIAFTDWPEGSFATDDAPLVIGVLGQAAIAGPLGDIVAKETCRGHSLKLIHVTKAAEAKNCHVLFVPQSEAGRWRGLRAQLARVGILTVGDGENFAAQGGIVQFAIDQNRLRLTVNLAAARVAGIAISSKVLRLAQVIDERIP